VADRPGVQQSTGGAQAKRRQIHEAARKLRSAKSSTIHLSRSSRIPTEPCSAIGAPRGDRSNSRRHDYVVPLGGHADQATLVNGRNGELRNDHPYVSAVLVVHDLGDGAYRSDAYITNSSNAALLPSALFAGPKDAFYDYEASLDAYVPRAQGARAPTTLSRGPR
jgi:hypothetical protein